MSSSEATSTAKPEGCPSTLRLVVNGKARELSGVTTVQEAVRALGFDGDYFAVALNLQFVPRSQYALTTLRDGDDLEILSPMQGG